MWCLPAAVTVLLVVQRVVYLQSELVFCRNVRIYPHTGQSNICTKHSRAAELMEADSAAPVWPAAGNGAATVTVTAAALCWCQWFLSMDWFGHVDTMGGRRNEMKRYGLDGYLSKCWTVGWSEYFCFITGQFILYSRFLLFFWTGSILEKH